MRKIIFSKRASSRLEALLLYLEREWSVKVKYSFIAKLDKGLEQIQNHPDSCPTTDAVKRLHRMIITKQTSIFYRYDLESIIIVSVSDNRMNPKA
ncbi:MAG: type II toxin-antitoxin system RelE/ParE family toxin [Bacteroidales bacterium]